MQVGTATFVVAGPVEHQEYGVLSLAAHRDGHTTAEQQLLDFAAGQGSSPTSFLLPVPPWVHPAWLVCVGLLTLVVARKVVGLRWTATLLTATYLGYRAVVWGLLAATGFPSSVLPVMLLAGAVLVDCAVTWGVPGWAAGVPVAAAVFAAAFVQEFVAVIPPWQWSVAPVVWIGFAVLWGVVGRVGRTRRWARWRAPVALDHRAAAVAGGAPAP